MTGTISVKRLNKSGLYVSALIKNSAFVDNCCPHGLAKMFVEPFHTIYDADSDSNTIEYAIDKENGGYLISGEAYIVCGYDEKEIDLKIREHKKEYRDHFANVSVKHVELSLAELQGTH